VNRPLYCKAFDDHQLTLSLIRADAGLTGRFGLARTRDLRWGDVSKHHQAAGT